MTVDELRGALETDEIPTLAQVLSWLPRHIAAEFDCPDHGPHEFLEVAACNVTWRFCKYCKRKEVIRGWVDTRVQYDGVPFGFWQR